MTAQRIVPCLWLDCQAEEAAEFYARVLPAVRVTAVSRYPEAPNDPSGRPRGSVLTVEFEAGGQCFTALNGGPAFSAGPSISFFVHVDAPEEAERLCSALGRGGSPLMPFGAYPWSAGYAWVQDRFGVTWQVIAGRRPAGGADVVPCLMFSGSQRGRAEEAIRAYVRVFPGGRTESLECYASGEGPAGLLKHGRFTLAGQPFVAMDSHVENAFAFNEGISLQVMCRDQGEVDRYWASLSEGGEPGRCGWLKDRFGVSWQVVPIAIRSFMASDDAEARGRAFEALLEMQKLDVARLQAAFDGRRAR